MVFATIQSMSHYSTGLQQTAFFETQLDWHSTVVLWSTSWLFETHGMRRFSTLQNQPAALIELLRLGRMAGHKVSHWQRVWHMPACNAKHYNGTTYHCKADFDFFVYAYKCEPSPPTCTEAPISAGLHFGSWKSGFSLHNSFSLRRARETCCHLHLCKCQHE